MFMQELHDQHRYVGEATVDVASIASGATATVTIPVIGAQKDKGQTVEYGLPSTFDTALTVAAYVSDDDEVTIVLSNPTGGAIDPASGLYSVRVRP